MGTKGTVLCDWRSCGICNIVKSGFECVAFGAPGNKGRSVQCIITQPHFPALTFVHSFQTWRWPVFFHGSLRGGPVCYFMLDITISSYGCLRCHPATKYEPKQFGLSHLPPVTSVFLMELTDSDGGPSRGAGFRNHYSEIHRHVH